MCESTIMGHAPSQHQSVSKVSFATDAKATEVSCENPEFDPFESDEDSQDCVLERILREIINGQNLINCLTVI
jgi:hypothetical protein